MLNTTLHIALLLLGAIDHPSLDEHPEHIRKALTEARNVYLNESPDSASAVAELAMVYQANNFFEPARQAFEEAEDRSSKDARWPYYLGLLAMQQGRFNDAQRALTRSLALNPSYLPARVRLAQAQQELGKTKAARKSLATLVEEHPDLAPAHAMLGRLALAEGQFELAITHLGQALALQPDASALATPLAMAHRGAGDQQQAAFWLARRGNRDIALVDPLNQRMMAKSRSYNYFLTLGIEAADSGDLDQGLVYLNSARQIAPENPNVLVTLARMLEAKGDLTAAVEAADQALAKDPDYPLAQEQRGVLAEMLGDQAQAVQWYRQALQGDESLFHARLLLANYLMRTAAYDESAQQLKLLRQLRPADNTVVQRLAVSLVESGRCADAARELDQQLRTQPDQSLGLVFVRVVASCDTGVQQDQALALNAARQFYARQPDVDVTSALAMIELAAGNQQAAIQYQQQAIFTALRDGLDASELTVLSDSLKAIEAGQRPSRPWPKGHQISVPAPAEAGDR